MKQLTALLWKEWFEVRLFLAIGLFVFLGLPLIGAMENTLGRRFEIQASLWVFTLGGVLAVIIAVGIVVRDLNGRLEEFWRSRPVSTLRWLLVKYVVGLAVVLTTLGVPLIVEFLLNRKVASFYDPGLMLKWQPFFWAALYSLSFAIASLLRRGAHAAMLSIAVMLLLYFLPTVLPPIHFLSLDQVMDSDILKNSGRIEFAMGMIGLSVMGLVVSLAAVRNDWRIESDRKLIYWSIGGALLILFSSAAFQVASNLPLLQQVKLPGGETIAKIFSDGSAGYVWTTGHYTRDPATQSWVPKYFVRRLKVGPSSVELGPPIEIKGEIVSLNMIWRPEHPDVFYVPSQHFSEEPYEQYPKLQTIRIHDGTATVDVQSFPDQKTTEPGTSSFPQLYASYDRLYVLWPRLMTFDISDPPAPKLISITDYSRVPLPDELGGEWWQAAVAQAEKIVVPLPLFPDVPAAERLKMSILWRGGLDGEILIPAVGDSVTTYQLDKLSNTSAIFRRLGHYAQSPVEQLFGRLGWMMEARDGVVYQAGWNGLGNASSITAYDITSPHPRPIGHFALPKGGIRDMRALPQGRLLVGSDSLLILLGPPPGRK